LVESEVAMTEWICKASHICSSSLVQQEGAWLFIIKGPNPTEIVSFVL
jgi:hypothetical protein